MYIELLLTFSGELGSVQDFITPQSIYVPVSTDNCNIFAKKSTIHGDDFINLYCMINLSGSSRNMSAPLRMCLWYWF